MVVEAKNEKCSMKIGRNVSGNDGRTGDQESFSQLGVTKEETNFNKMQQLSGPTSCLGSVLI